MTLPAKNAENDVKLPETDKQQQSQSANLSQSDNKQAPIDASNKPAISDENEVNWKKFREERAIERKAKLDAEKRANDREAEALALKAALESLVSKPAPRQEEKSDDAEETEDERIDKKVQKALDAQRDRMEAESRKKEIADLPSKLASTFSDFSRVCTQENLDYLEYHYPEVAAGFRHSPETFETWTNFYKTLKRFVPNLDGKKEQARIEKNLGKPQSMSQPGATQTGDYAPHELSEKRRADNWQRMSRIMKGM